MSAELKVVAWMKSNGTHMPRMRMLNETYLQGVWDFALVRLSDAEAALQAKEAEIAALKEDAARQRDEDREILAAVVRELGEGSDGNAPGHAHSLPGIWDWDNGEKAGKACSWCLCWTKFTALAARAAQEAKA